MYTNIEKSVRNSVLKNDVRTAKKATLRYNEYYDLQPIFDNLYKQSKEGSVFKHLYSLITKEENILLAYRRIKRNQGSKTSGTNRKTIKHWETKPTQDYLRYIRTRLDNYIPQKIRRVEIPKSNGKLRPLGIPCIEDRIIQQCIKQVLEPICEAKFHKHSYGFRPNRSTENAIAYVYKKINLDHNYFMVDVDIKGFFDNVNHSKLLKQLWTMGIRDKKVISIISAMLKAEIEGIGIPTKGVPQGGILSPLLSNIVLNELDWWISSQWETFETQKQYSVNFSKYTNLRRTSKLKEIYIVRYADDFKIMCRNYTVASKVFIAVQKWLKERLGLDISPEKSKITDVRKEPSEFLGFKIRAYRKHKKWIVISHMTDKAKRNAQEIIKNQLRQVQKCPSHTAIYLLNRMTVGLQNYYKVATEISKDFSQLEYKLSYYVKSKLKQIRTNNGEKTQEYIRRYKDYKNRKEIYIKHQIMYPIGSIRTKPPSVHNNKISNYTAEGRDLLHKRLGYINTALLSFLAHHPLPQQSVEYNDNRLSLYAGQRGRDKITNLPLDETLRVHRIIPTEHGGTDKYNNLILVQPEIYLLIHLTHRVPIKMHLIMFKINTDQIKKINLYRKKIGNEIIKSD